MKFKFKFIALVILAILTGGCSSVGPTPLDLPLSSAMSSSSTGSTTLVESIFGE